MSSALDRDAAREKLPRLYVIDQEGDPELLDPDVVLDALEGCVRPDPAQTIDRDAAERYVREQVVMPMTTHAAAVDALLALLRPVDGVTLTREEAAFVRQNVLHDLVESNYDPEDVALGQRIAARLEAAS